MQDFINDIRNSLESRNYYAALALSLSTIDICGAIDSNGISTEKHYVEWSEKYLLKYFQMKLPNEQSSMVSHEGVIDEPAIFEKNRQNRSNYNKYIMSALYQLRCKFLHQGLSSFDTERRKTFVSEFELSTVDLINNDIASEQIPTMLRINEDGSHITVCVSVVMLCRFICRAVENWVAEIQSDNVKKTLISSVVKIYEPYDAGDINGIAVKIIGQPQQNE